MPIYSGTDDVHARAHAEDIRRRFAGRTVTIGQIVMFGLTRGLIPYPATIAALLLCIQLKQLSLGFLLVLCSSISLPIAMVSAGVLAARSIGCRDIVCGSLYGLAGLARAAGVHSNRICKFSHIPRVAILCRPKSSH